MMRAILGSAIGGVVAGAVALVASAQGRSAPEATWPAAQANAPYAMTVANTSGLNTAAPTVIHCQPHQEAVMQRSFVDNREVAQVTCVNRMAPSAYGAPGYAASYAAPYVAPAAAAYYAPPVYSQPDIVQRPAVRRQSVRPRAQRTTYVQREEVQPKRSWKKTALIIGGSSAAGAGVGAIAGGKKGALIGAAIGGGAATVYEVVKRK